MNCRSLMISLGVMLSQMTAGGELSDDKVPFANRGENLIENIPTQTPSVDPQLEGLIRGLLGGLESLKNDKNYKKFMETRPSNLLKKAVEENDG